MDIMKQDETNDNKIIMDFFVPEVKTTNSNVPELFAEIIIYTSVWKINIYEKIKNIMFIQWSSYYSPSHC